MLPEVEFWCSPPHLQLSLGERPEVSTSPVTESNRTDHCLMYSDSQEGDNTTQCTR